MRMISTALGCDGVLADFVAGALQLVEEITGKRFSPAEVSSHNFLETLDLTADEVLAVREALGARQGLVLSLRPYPGARQGVRQLRKLGEVFCISTCHGSPVHRWLAERESWLALHFGIDRVHHVIDEGSTWRAADVFVDCSTARVQAWLAMWPGRTAVLWRTPHNSREVTPSGASAIDSWEGLYEIALRVARLPAPADGGPS